MQRIADRIQREFSSNGSYIEVNALDGNGDAFRVYQGKPSDLTGHSFINILRDPACFYFFNITCLPDLEQPEALIRRDLCWLTDPLAPLLETSTSTSLLINWNPVRFCGIGQTDMVNSLTYTIELAEGVDWKETALARYMNDNIASTYRVVFRGKNATSALLENLKPARWYHARLTIDYLGLRVMSESASFHTLRSTPSIPSTPRVSVVPVRSSFDTSSSIPARLDVLISWNASTENGYPIEKYQVHVKRFDVYGKILADDPPLLRKKIQMNQHGTNPQKTISSMIKTTKQANQWISSPGKSEVQIRNSLSSRSGMRSRSPSPTGRSPSPSPNPNNLASLGQVDASSSQVFQGNKRPQTWKIVYENLNRTVKMLAPKDLDGEWWIRVRAKNAEGWSGFSSVCVINHFNYPSLFPNPMLKEAENQDDYMQLDANSQLPISTTRSFSSNNPHPDSTTSSQNQTFPAISSLQINDSPYDQQQQHRIGGKSSATTPSAVASNEYLVITKTPTNKDQGSNANHHNHAHHDNQSSVQFRNHHYEHLDRLQDHKDEVGLFWDHKATNPTDGPQADQKIKGSASHDDEIIYIHQSGDSYHSGHNDSGKRYGMTGGGMFPEISRK